MPTSPSLHDDAIQPNTAPIETMSCSSMPAAEPQKLLLALRAQSNHAPSPHNRPSVARQKRNSWMQTSVVRRAAAVVDEEVAALCERSPFLNSITTTTTTTTTNTHTTSAEIALFHRSEVQLGKPLGQGGFAEVYTVTGFQVGEDEKGGTRRLECQEKATSSSGRPAYAIKFLSQRLLSKTREFQHAAIDLAVESKYLAALSHPNIIKIRALTLGGTSAFRSGKHDDYFIIMDHLQETLEQRLQRWNARMDGPPQQYFPRTLQYAHQIADALAYLHDKSIVYRDLKPQNLGFRERDVIQLFDFGLCRELPKPKGQSHRENLEDEETFHMSGVGTQRYMAPEIINSRCYNLKADVYSWSMVALSMFTWKKPFSAYSPEEHQKNVAFLGKRPHLAVCDDDDSQHSSELYSEVISAHDWPSGMAELIQDSWTQDVSVRLSMGAVLERMETIIANHEEEPIVSYDNTLRNEVVLEFPSHFSPRHQLSEEHRHQDDRRRQQHQQQTMNPVTREDLSDPWFGERQSDTSSSYQELTMTSESTSASTTTTMN